MVCQTKNKKKDKVGVDDDHCSDGHLDAGEGQVGLCGKFKQVAYLLAKSIPSALRLSVNNIYA